MAPLSIVQPAPTSTLSPITNDPSCSIFSYPSLDDAKPNPSDPKIALGCILQLSPIDTSLSKVVFG